jgi:hypothetical protein
VPKQLANSRRSARHSMVEAESIDGLQLFRGQHDLQPLFPHQTRTSFAILHEGTSYKSGK